MLDRGPIDTIQFEAVGGEVGQFEIGVDSRVEIDRLFVFASHESPAYTAKAQAQRNNPTADLASCRISKQRGQLKLATGRTKGVGSRSGHSARNDSRPLLSVPGSLHELSPSHSRLICNRPSFDFFDHTPFGHTSP